MNLAPARQLELLETLASQPDYLGLDHFAEPLARLEVDFAKATQAPSAIPEGPDQPSDRQSPDWQTFQLNQQAWKLFTHLQFGDQINDARLQEEVIAQIARTSLQALKGKTTGQWQQTVTRQMIREFADFRNDPAEAS
ncbi:hypothetical protein [Endozoicomonas sp. ONNA2]|uniref:hypothetical protein n=1 Tax=Endozoicomonas sp. ONNA2 TaxID=2828741 RepID=UPI0021497BBF|nr:hypothetical protein [Endozoicomonas sp. ONNA2]